MTQVDFLRFTTALQSLATLYKHDLSDGRLKHYWEALVDIPIERVVGACMRIGRDAGEGRLRFFPLPGTIRAHQCVLSSQKVDTFRQYYDDRQ